ncbi:MAG TPA: sulfurtransferase [Burkholderiales bacterium]|nr:sulfurtransferase [Burkholderiales bacterium]
MPATTLVTVDELAAHLTDPGWCVFDCRHDLADPGKGERAYRESHIPGARFAHLDRDLSGARTGRNGRHPLPDPAAFAQWLGQAGVGNAAQIIAYDDAGGAFAARLWWLSRWLGHESVALLDGGWSAWLAAGGPTTDVAPAVTPTRFEGHPDPSMTVDAAWVEAHLDTTAFRLIDARSPDRYRGENETIDPVAGHIPGAANRFFRDNLLADGRFASPDALRAAFAAIAAGMPPTAIVHQCGSGVTACHNLLAMEIAGLPGARLYPGSWSEWCSDPRRPVVKG